MTVPQFAPLYLARFYVHPAVTKIRGKQWAHICRGGKWIMSYCCGPRFMDAVYFVHDLNARLPEIT